jgi:hypothetical protein
VYATRPLVFIVLVRGLDDAKQASAVTADITRARFRASQVAKE